MKATFTYLIFAMCFLHSRAAIMTNMIPEVEGLQDVRSIFKTMKDLIKPFGCLDIVPGPEMSSVIMQCMKEVFTAFKDDAFKDDQIQLPSFKEVVNQYTLCRLKINDLLDGEKLSLPKYLEVQKSITFIQSNPEDVEVLESSFNSCKQQLESDITDMPAVNAILTLEKCIIGMNIDYCREVCGARSVGFMLPVVYSLYSLDDENDNCDSVRPDTRVLEEYAECLEKEAALYEEEQIPGMGGNPMMKIMTIVNGIAKVPEIMCLAEVSESNGFSNDCKTNYSALAEYIGDLDGWVGEEVKNEVTTKMEECGNNESEFIWLTDLHFIMCFLPTFTDICGLDNDLASDILFPMINEEFLSSVLQRLHDRYDLTDLMGIIPF